MRKLIAVLSALALMGSVAQADNVGSSFGALMTAQSLSQGQVALGGRLGVADANSFTGSLGYGFSSTGDVRLKGGVVGDRLAESEAALGADTKWQIMKVYDVDSRGEVARTSDAMDLAVGPFLEWSKRDFRMPTSAGSSTATQLGVNMVGSYPVHFNSGGTLTPYARVNARNEWLNTSVPDGAGGRIEASDSHLAMGFNGGVAWRPTPGPVALYGEFQADGNNGMFFGLDYLIAR